MKAQQDAHETQTGQTLAEVIGEAREWMKAEAGKRWQPTPGRQRRRLPMHRPTWRLRHGCRRRRPSGRRVAV